MVGSLGGLNFFTNVTLTMSTDTSKIESSPVNGCCVPTVFGVFGPATVDLKAPGPAYVGNASATFTDTMEVFVDQNARVAGFFDPKTGFILSQFNNVAFASYDLSTPIGGFICCGSTSSGVAPTSAGDLHITAIDFVSFNANVAPAATPEPASVVLLGAGLVFSLRRRIKILMG